MKFDIAKSLKNWRTTTSDRVKLQHVYLALAVSSVIIAGLVGLVDYTAGQRMVSLGLLSLGVYIINMIAWALIDGLLLMRLDRYNVASKSNAAKPAKKASPKARSAKK